MRQNPINRSERGYGDYKSKEPLIQSQQVVVGANSSATINFNIEGSYDFEFFRFSYKSTGAFKIQLSVDSKKIFNTPISNSVFSGLEGSTMRGQLLWHTFKAPLFIYRNTNLIVYLENTTGSNNTIEIVIDGIKYVYTV